MVSTDPDQQSINVSWMILDCQDRHGIITMYEIRYTSSDFGDNVDLLNITNGDETSSLLPELEEFKNYTIEVRAYTAVGPGHYSAPVNVRTLPDSKYIVYVCLCVCTCVCFIANACSYNVFACQIISRCIVVPVCFNSSQWSSD